MKRFLTIVAAMCLIASSAMAANYGWSISSSAISADVNTGPVSPGPLGLPSLYLWLKCSSEGMSAADMTVTSSSPANIIVAFAGLNGYLNAGTASGLLLAVGGCPSGPVLAGRFDIVRNLPLDICLTGNNLTVDCLAPTAFPHAVQGFSELTVGCTSGGILCPPVSIEDTSWGSIKGLYR